MIGVFKGTERIGSLLKVTPNSKPWHAYAADGKGENFKTRKEAVAWLADQTIPLLTPAEREAEA